MKDYYLRRAEENLPPLNEEVIIPTEKNYVLKSGDTVLLDLGCHYVGYFSFRMWYVDEYIDAPVRLSVKFLETQGEIDEDFSVYNGWLCRSWLQDEVINVDFPGEYKMPRRYACRYVKIEVLNASQTLSLSDFKFTAVTSADTSALKAADVKDEELKKIDKVAVTTLKNCMQRVFEDGPKRDRRLWIGDLRLEALANYYTFGDTRLVKRCLYLFAAATRNEYGFMPGFVYENPIFVSGSWYLEDYSLLYVCALCDYLQHIDDKETFLDLYETAKSIMDAVHSTQDERGIITAPTSDEDVFIDWCEGLEKKSAFMGVYLYTLDLWVKALRAVGKPEAEEYEARLEAGRKNARLHLFDEEKCAVINVYDKGQYSVHATAWLILGGAIEGEEARRAITDALASKTALKPFTPYMHHYTVDALVKSGLSDRAVEYIRNIWGGMVRMGADTFFEAYSATDPSFSPYGDKKVNSMCHAWSCTPTYFIRKYGFGL